MIYFLIGLGVFVLLILWRLYSVARIYKPIFAPEHFVEIAESMGPAIESAYANSGKELSGPIPEGDPSAFMTSAGVALIYTAAPEGDKFEHHLSLSIPGRVTPGAVGRTFLVYISLLLGIDPRSLSIGISENFVYHAAFIVDEKGHEAIRNRRIKIPTVEEAKVIGPKCAEEGRNLECESFKVGL